MGLATMGFASQEVLEGKQIAPGMTRFPAKLESSAFCLLRGYVGFEEVLGFDLVGKMGQKGHVDMKS